MDEAGRPSSEAPAASRRSRVPLAAAAGMALAVGLLVVVRVDDDAPSRSDGSSTVPAGVAADDPPSRLPAGRAADFSFVDVTERSGLVGPAGAAPQEYTDFSGGAAVADVFGTGRPDLFVTRQGRASSLYRNDGDGTFTDVAPSAGVVGTDPSQGAGPAAFADVDADGCPDLYVAGLGSAPDALYVNRCDGTFVDETRERGLTAPVGTAPFGNQVHGVTFGDLDNDGDLDLVVLQWDQTYRVDPDRPGCEGLDTLPDPSAASRSRLWINDGTGRFTDGTQAWGLDLEDVAAFTGQLVDLDDDGWLDLLVAADFCGSRVLRNDGGRRFVDDTVRAGIAELIPENGMGSAVADLDADGNADWVITSVSHPAPDGICPLPLVARAGCSGNRAFLGRGDGTFRDATDRLGLRAGWWGWGVVVADFDNDGTPEVVQANGFRNGPDPSAQDRTLAAEVHRRFAADPLRFWVRHEGRYEDGAAAVGLDHTGLGRCLVPVDVDVDGRLDLLLCDPVAGPRLYRNESRAGDWLRVRLDDPASPGNRAGVGARVEVELDDARTVVAWISTDGSYESQRPAEVHVGLGSARVREVRVRWPGAAAAQEVRDVGPGVVTITRRGS